jgi:hypothetical protein
MKYHTYKAYIGSLISFIKLKPFNLKTYIIFISSLFLFNAASSFQSSGVLDDAIQRGTQSAHFGYLKLNMNSNNLNYHTEFYFNSNASRALDPGYDAAIAGGNLPAFSIYSRLVQNDSGMAFAVQALSDTDMNNVTVSLGVRASQGQDVIISITETDYQFTADDNLSGIGRFYLRFEGDALGTTEQSLKGLDLYSNVNKKIISVKGQLQSETNLKLYDINGRLVSTIALDITSTTQTINTANFGAGIYIAQLVNKTNQKRTQKLIIN